MSAETTENERVTAVEDYYLLDATLSEDERDLGDRVREFGDREVLPIVNDYWERAEFPFELVPKLAGLNVAGTTIQGYGCPGLSRLGAGVVARELARADGSINTFFGVHSGLAMGAIDLLGSDEQKERWLPPMARMETIGAFGLTEPEHGSDSVSLETTARRDAGSGEFILNGAKRWIGNASFADVVIIWARDEAGDVGAYLVEKGTAGFDPSTVIGGKIGKRAVWQAEIVLTDVRVPADHKLVHANTFKDANRLLNQTRSGAAWESSATRRPASTPPSPTPAIAPSSAAASPAFSSSRESSPPWPLPSLPCSSTASASPSSRRPAR
jgi:glutaryl-CoA dehydrogenase